MISAKCITYGRTHLLVEALHSFLQQDENIDSELVIVNDYPLQKLIFDHPRVKIYNLDETFGTIGEKENFAIERCSGELIVVYDDDDVALPWHFNNILKYWKEDTNLLKWDRAVYYNEPHEEVLVSVKSLPYGSVSLNIPKPQITSITKVGNSGIVYSKKAWEAIGKSPIMNAGGDMELVKKIKELGEDKVVYATPPDNEVSWFYRWALPRNYHQSGQGTDVPGRPNIVQRNAEYVESQRKLGNIPTGDIQLIPKWRYDYIKLLKDYNECRVHNISV